MNNKARRRTVIVIIMVLLLLALALLLSQCLKQQPPAGARDSAATQPSHTGGTASSEQTSTQPDEVLTPATLTAPQQVAAGAAVIIVWTGPDNRGDFVTIVAPNASDREHGNYQETQRGSPLTVAAPIDPGSYEVRYVTARSHTVLARAAIEVMPTAATLDAADAVTLGAAFSVKWTGPANEGDYITIVPKDARDQDYGSYAEADRGSPVTLTAPATPGDAELRYVTGQDKRVLARKPIRVLAADVTLSAPDKAIAGATIEVTWTGPDNQGDYITIVPAETPDGQYGNYTDTAKGSPLNLLLPIMEGQAELRYMTGQGRRVLARRLITIVAAEVTLSAPTEGAAGSDVSITWTGPNNPGDYITIVAKDLPDGRYAAYTLTSQGSPLTVKAPAEAGDAEVRYMTGQGNKVLARIPIRIVP